MSAVIDKEKKTSNKSKSNDLEIIDNPVLSSKVENFFLDKSKKKLRYEPTENISIIQVDNFPELGKITALRFIEWVLENPKGVVSLPTGKTPEHFIKWVQRILNDWDTKYIKSELSKVGISTKVKPDFSGLRFVQIDDFYPIDSNQHNSFYYYIKKYYFKILGLDPEKALFINVNEIPTPNNLPLKEIFPENKVDLSLRTRFPRNKIERLQKKAIELVDEYCTRYERKIREMGGIDFFLGGIGPDGHIGFNVKGSDHYSTTRLIETNYETQSAAASDLGGMEVARNRLVITIGLNTITYNKNAVAIIIAAGESKGNIVRDSIQNGQTNTYPATALQVLDNARFYLTRGSAFRLTERRFIDLANKKNLSKEETERAVVNLVVKEKKRVFDLDQKDFKNDKIAQLVLNKSSGSIADLTSGIKTQLTKRLDKGLKPISNEVILHTAPHHDDIMLGYLHYFNHLVRNPDNHHHFSYFTSGFTAVTNQHMLDLLVTTKKFVDSGKFKELFDSNYFDPTNVDGKNSDVSLYLDGISARSRTLKQEALSRRTLRNMIEIYEEENLVYLEDRLNELINYFETQYPGKKDIPHVQKLKGMLREWEVEVLWGRYGFGVSDITNLRLGFYQGNIFTENPTINRDVLPVLELLEKTKPTIVTVALDPESSGPDTHYKVMQVISEALQMYSKNNNNTKIKVWGYRNVWSKYHPSEANIYIPISLNSFAIMEKSFMDSFGSQKNASFPSWEHDGPFHELAQRIQVDHYETIRTALGKNYFLNNVHPRLRAAKGILLLKELTLNEFYKYSLDLKKLTEIVGEG